MNVRELREKLVGLDDDSPVIVRTLEGDHPAYYGVSGVSESGNFVPTVYIDAR